MTKAPAIGCSCWDCGSYHYRDGAYARGMSGAVCACVRKNSLLKPVCLPDYTTYVAAFFTRHLIRRIIERLHALTAENVTSILRAAWPYISLAERVVDQIVQPEIGD